ncbi:DNA-formamidopyrimidine glycosylase family protein [Kocuria rhizophila]|uniref:DNA-formamidopyrimidine glycosylase family protein n=1 Tax=Kocuria rhizophila TaxID=72000 RepID=UPI00174E2190|nr:DNA-formamidopyrimidine glycosylase family protein [Kocuria rhizophila]MCG7425743.1 integrase [Kocuria rhizophila]MCT1456044.1 integrase [Kocuria rhizophila]MCT1880084.1 integrase [Kocuria rhizophila]MCT2249144.1 integrase [Kocuria rhizophila]
MPEGDSVYRQCKMLREALEGAVIESSDFRVPALATSDVSGRTVVAVVPRGKHILIRLSAAPDAAGLTSGAEPLTLHSHLMMDGTWRVFDRQQDDAAARPGRSRSRPGANPYRPRGQARRGGSVRSAAEARTRISADVAIGQGSHTIRAILRTKEVEAVGFDVKDVRLVPTRLEEPELVGYLGPDILGPDWDLEKALERLSAQPDRAIGTALMDQRNLAGIGNVYRVETLFMTRTNPWARVDSLPEGKLREIVTLAHKLLHLNKDRSMRSTVGQAPQGRPLFWAYGKDGQPCRRCGTQLKRGEIDDALLTVDPAPSRTAVQHLRTIAWCPRCQAAA